MPDRIVRDELLDSEPYLSLSSDTARMLFIHLILVADDLGNFDAGPRFIIKRCLEKHSSESVTALLTELADKDLVRLYTANSKPYGHIPRFKQRVRYVKRSHPRPPKEVEWIEIKELLPNSLSKASLQPDLGRTVVGRSEEKLNTKTLRLSEHATESASAQKARSTLNKDLAKANPIGPDETMAEYHDRLKALQRQLLDKP